MNNLRKLREDRNLSLQDLSDLFFEREGIRFGRSSLNNYERGIQSPKIETWTKFANLFDVPTAYIMGVNETDGDMVSIPKAEYEELLAIKEQMEVIKEILK